ncbi:hypothetical protein WR25_19111 [Diploscapter pachys]|uniref:Uncharacterized protein n=1 Tax=Diploscapter pachys TaxID=2018661 RepID=A0A2A2L336_9BILA|nr:hypothetical protein WR25_19111 [Diploscapter pachys]
MSDELTNSATSGTADMTEAMETETEAVTPPTPSGQAQEAQQPGTSANIAAMIQENQAKRKSLTRAKRAALQKLLSTRTKAQIKLSKLDEEEVPLRNSAIDAYANAREILEKSISEIDKALRKYGIGTKYEYLQFAPAMFTETGDELLNQRLSAELKQWWMDDIELIDEEKVKEIVAEVRKKRGNKSKIPDPEKNQEAYETYVCDVFAQTRRKLRISRTKGLDFKYKQLAELFPSDPNESSPFLEEERLQASQELQLSTDATNGFDHFYETFKRHKRQHKSGENESSGTSVEGEETGVKENENESENEEEEEEEDEIVIVESGDEEAAIETSSSQGEETANRSGNGKKDRKKKAREEESEDDDDESDESDGVFEEDLEDLLRYDEDELSEEGQKDADAGEDEDSDIQIIDVVDLVATLRAEKRKLSVEGEGISTPAKLPKLSPAKSTPDRLSTGPVKLRNTTIDDYFSPTKNAVEKEKAETSQASGAKKSEAMVVERKEKDAAAAAAAGELFSQKTDTASPTVLNQSSNSQWSHHATAHSIIADSTLLANESTNEHSEVDVVNNSSTTDSAANSKEKQLSQKNAKGLNESAKVGPATESAQTPVTSKETEGKSIDIGKTVETVEKTGNGDGENERGEGQKVQDVIRAEEGTRAAKGAEDEEDDDIIVDAVIQGDCQEYIEPINSAKDADVWEWLANKFDPPPTEGHVETIDLE